ADDIDETSAFEHPDCRAEVSRACRATEGAEGETVAGSELLQQTGRVAPVALHRALELSRPLSVGGGRMGRQELVAEQRLHLARTIESEALGEAHDRRRLDATPL